MTELWKPVVGYEGLYLVSDLGRVKSARNGKIMALHNDGRGYWQVGLFRAGKKTSQKVHRLVCRAFNGQPTSGQDVAHLDGDRANASASNLVWATQSENERHKLLHGRSNRGEAHPMVRLSENDVADIRVRSANGETRTSVAAAYGISHGHVSDIVNGKKWPEGDSAGRDSGIAQPSAPQSSGAHK